MSRAAPTKRIEFSKQEIKAMVGDLRRYFTNELDQDLGQLPAELLLDFFADQMGAIFIIAALPTPRRHSRPRWMTSATPSIVWSENRAPEGFNPKRGWG